MWVEFLKKLHVPIQLKWPTELNFTLFTMSFSALVDARRTAKGIGFAEALEAQEVQ